MHTRFLTHKSEKSASIMHDSMYKLMECKVLKQVDNSIKNIGMLEDSCQSMVSSYLHTNIIYDLT